MSHYDAYFLSPQLGGGIGPLYRTPIYIQRGRGLGSAFRGLLRLIFPSIKSAGTALLKEAGSAGLNVLSQLNSRPIEEVLKSQAKKSFSNLSIKAENKLKKFRDDLQTGSGRGRKRIKRDLIENLPINNLLMASKGSSRRKPSRKVKKRKARKGKVSKKNRVKKGRVVRKKRSSKTARTKYLKQLFAK